jgi:hypothetical protein
MTTQPTSECEGSSAQCQAPNKQSQRTVTRHRGDAASASFHYALASRFIRQRVAAELRRYAALTGSRRANGDLDYCSRNKKTAPELRSDI